MNLYVFMESPSRQSFRCMEKVANETIGGTANFNLDKSPKGDDIAIHDLIGVNLNVLRLAYVILIHKKKI
jgi:hypothetical protein